MEWRLFYRFGNVYAEGRYKGEEWHGWLFPTSKKEKPNYIYVPELGVWRRNTSI